MEPNKQNITSLFSASYVVPDFQRPYTWTDEQVNDLLTDVMTCISGSDSKQEELFLGVVVLLKDADGTGARVVDGQQRITTLYLLTIALHDTVTEVFEKSAADYSLNSLLNASAGGKRATWVPKVKLNFEPDQDVLLNLLRGNLIDSSLQDNRLVRAFALLKTGIERWLSENRPSALSRQEYFEAMLLPFRTEPFVFTLTANDESQGFELFETLNSKGTPLSAADLIKNKILGIAAKAKPDRTAEALRCWEEIASNCGESGKGTGVEEFIRTYWHAFIEDVPTHRLYRRFLARVDKLSPQQVLNLVRDMRDASNHYRVLWNPTDKHPATKNLEARNSLIRLNYLGSKVSRTILLAALVARPKEFSPTLHYVETVAVRAAIGRRATNQIHDAYWRVAQQVTKEGEDETIVALLKAKLDDYLPGDNEFIADARKYEFARRNTQRAILLALNDTYAQGAVDMYAPKRANVEHILPQKPMDKAKVLKSLGVDEKEYSVLKNRLGNLTLWAEKPNKKDQNRPYNIKRKSYKDSDVNMTRDIADRFSTFGRKQLDLRTKLMAKKLAAAYPL